MKSLLSAFAAAMLLAAFLAGCTAPVPTAPAATAAPASSSTTELTPTVTSGEVEAGSTTTETTEAVASSEALTPTIELTPTVTSQEAITSSTESTATTSAGLANPASQYCVNQGGSLTIEERGDGGQFGVCTFDDNRQCEEWAMMRGECPVGGLKVTGYLTPAARYCAITGGEYTDNGTTSADDEKGICSFKGGATCPAADYYNGTCTP